MSDQQTTEDDTAAELLDLLHDIRRDSRASEREAMSMASVAAYVQNQQRMLHTGARHDAQADAFLKAKLAACGLEHLYQPPEADKDMAGSTFINCRIAGDEAIQQIAKTVQAVTDDKEDDQKKTDDVEQPPPAQPQPTQPTNGKRDSTLAKAAILGAALMAGGGAGALITQWLTPDNTPTTIIEGDPAARYEMMAIPFEPQRTNTDGM